MAALVLEYYVLLRSVLRAKPHLRACLSRCRHCRIFFLTHPRNAGRKTLRCPFGCREAHRKQQSTVRSVAFYQGEHGRILKKYQNDKRRGPASAEERRTIQKDQGSDCEPQAGSAAQEQPPQERNAPRAEPQSSPCPPRVAQALPKAQDPVLMEHVRMVVSLLEGRPVSLEEIWEMLARVLRQHTMGRRRKIDHTVAWLHENPP